MHKDQVDRFSFTKTLPPSCLISVHGSPDAVPTLHYSIPLEGVADPKTIDLLFKSPMTSSQGNYLQYVEKTFLKSVDYNCTLYPMLPPIFITFSDAH